MNFFIALTQIFFVISAILFGGLIFFSFAKMLQRKWFSTWKILDYVSVGYAEHLYKKYIEKPLTLVKSVLFQR
jgi:hypothetical protein